MYKLIAIDLDGTLLNSEGEITEANKKALKKAIDKGIHVILASGRVSTSVLELANQIGANEYFISGNGTSIVDIKQNKSIFNKYMSKYKVLEIAKICEENSIFYNLYTEHEVIANSLEHNVLFYYYENKRKDASKRVNINIIENVSKYIQNSNINKFAKITIADSDTAIFTSVLRKIKKVKDIDALEIGHMSRKTIVDGTERLNIEYNYTEITAKNTNKWTAIKYLMNKWGIKKEEVIAIGDNINDLEMVKNAGMGVAMGQSTPVLKEVANYITLDNNNDGVAKAIEEFI